MIGIGIAPALILVDKERKKMSQARQTILRAVKTTIVCDKCHTAYECKGCLSITDTKRLLKVNGWSFGKYIKCSNCRTAKKKETESEKNIM